jgi:hypothetical protein
MTNDANRTVGVVGALLGAAGCFGSFATSPAIFAERYGVSNEVFVGLSEFTLVCSALVVVGSIANAIRLRSRRIGLPTVSRQASPLLFHETRVAKTSELPAFRDMLVREFGETEVAPLAVFRRWHLKNSNIFQLVFEVNSMTGAQKLIGGFKAIPIKESLIPRIELEEFTGTNIPEEFVAKTGEIAKGFWVGDLVSTSRRNSVVVMAELRHFMQNNLRPDMRIFARGLTPKGLELLRGFGFVTVVDYRSPELGKICGLYPEDFHELLDRLQAGKPSRVGSRRAQKAKTGPEKCLNAGTEGAETSAYGFLEIPLGCACELQTV